MNHSDLIQMIWCLVPALLTATMCMYLLRWIRVLIYVRVTDKQKLICEINDSVDMWLMPYLDAERRRFKTIWLDAKLRELAGFNAFDIMSMDEITPKELK